MRSRSNPETKARHERLLHSERAEYIGVIPCAARLGRWLNALDITTIGDKQLSEPLAAFFLVQDLGSSRYHEDLRALR
jgi:hypothetical protein